MKKILAILIACLFVTSAALAWGGPKGSPWKSYVCDNATGIYTLTAVPTTIIPRGSAILGFQVSPLTANSENVVAIYDGPASATELIGEAECQPESYDGMWYPYPRTLEKQMHINQGGQTRVIVYFE